MTKRILLSMILLALIPVQIFAQGASAKVEGIADPAFYLDSIKRELQVQWPKNRTINLVFHGHSVPAGYFKTPDVRSFQAYPLLTHQAVKEIYPFAVLNAINTSIGGEQSESGAARFQRDVLTHRPDVLFIDYALNDRGIGPERAKKAWETMIEAALAQNIKVILLTPTPDWSVDILDDNTSLAQHARQIRELAAKYHVGLADSYAALKEKVQNGGNIRDYLSQINHPDENGHRIVTDLIMRYFTIGGTTPYAQETGIKAKHRQDLYPAAPDLFGEMRFSRSPLM